MKITIEPENGPVQVWSTEPAENRAELYEKRAEELESKLTEETDRAEAWELRCAELEQELRDVQAELDESVRKEAQLGLDRNKLKKSSGELEQENRYTRELLSESRKQRMELANDLATERQTVSTTKQKLEDLQHDHREMLERIAELTDRIHQQDLTIAKYDDENRELGNAKTDLEQTLKAAMAIKDHYKDECERLANLQWDKGSTALTRWAKAIHENAIEHGWWEEDRSFGDIVALCHSELSEALEEYRNDRPNAYIVGGQYGELFIEDPEKWHDRKPEGVAVEMIDCVIRILDWCGKEGIDVDEILRKKHEYNKTRPYRHGGKKL